MLSSFHPDLLQGQVMILTLNVGPAVINGSCDCMFWYNAEVHYSVALV